MTRNWVLGEFMILCVCSAAYADDGARLYPADIDWINNATRHKKATAQRVVVRSDVSHITKADKIARATLHLMPLAGQAVQKPVEVCPVNSDWGGLSAEFRKHEPRWVTANANGTLGRLIWEQAGKEGPEIGMGKPTFEARFRLGDVTWQWAAYPVLKWAAPGGDIGQPVGTIEPGPAMALDLTGLVKSWTNGDKANFGVMLRFADESQEPLLDLLGAYLVLEGKGVAVDSTPRIENHPDWLPRGYRTQHPRLCYPDEKWLAAVRANPSLLESRSITRMMGSTERLILKQRLAPAEERLKQIAEAVGRGKPFKFGRWVGLDRWARLYDWAYDLLSEEDRAVLALRLYRLCRACKPFWPANKPRGGDDLWPPLAVYPDIPGARKYVLRMKLHWVETILPRTHVVLGDHGGYWTECAGPYLSKTDSALCQVLTAWPSATGEDLLKKNPWLEYPIYTRYYGVRPDGLSIRFSLSNTHYRVPRVLGGVARMATQHYGNPYGPGARDGITPSARPWGPPLPKDFPEKGHQTLPLVYRADGEGIITMMSDWSEDATFIWFKCGITGRQHNRLDTGHFVIYKRAPLTVTSGCYSAARGPSGRHGCYHQLAISSNLVTVTDPNEKPFKIGWMLQDQPLPNDGGQRWTAGKFASGTPWSAAQFEKLGVHRTSKVLAFQPGKEFTYVCGDLTPAYTDRHSGTDRTGARSKRVRRFLRTLLFLPPNHLVLFDQVESFNKDFVKRWILHTVNPPKIDGATTVVEHANLIFRSWRYPNWSWDRNLKHAVRASEDHPFFREHPDCKWVKSSQPQLYQYDGVMVVHTLLPEKARLTTIGGPGKEFWVDGQNYGTPTKTKPTGQTQANPFRPKPHEITGEAGSWRVEVRPATARENDLFLHVFQVGVKSKDPKPTAANLIEAEGRTGVEVDLGDGRKATVAFKPGVGGHVRIERAGQVLVDQDLAEKVLPNLPIEK